MQHHEIGMELIVNELLVSYNDEGPDDAPVIIFIHGFPFNKSMWYHQAAALKDDYRIITYDVRGHGNTPLGNVKCTINLFASDLIGLMDGLKIETAFICGLSMGGYIALNAVEKYPERFEALILSDTQCKADTKEAKEKRNKSIENINNTGVLNYATDSLQKLFAPESCITKKNEMSAVKHMIMTTSPQSICCTLLALADRIETCSILSEITIPVLIMVGKYDVITPAAESILMHNKIHNSVIHILDHAGHLANIENYQAFNYQLKKFVDEVTKTIAITH